METVKIKGSKETAKFFNKFLADLESCKNELKRYFKLGDITISK